MKKVILILSMISIFCAKGQTQDTLQKKSYASAMERLKFNDLDVAYNCFKSAYFINIDNELGKKSLIKLDSLTIVLRKKTLEKIKGIWKNNDSNLNSEILIISNDEICFYDCGKEITKVEKLNFNNKKAIFSYYFELFFSEKKIWRIFINKDETLTLYNCGFVSEDGNIMITNHGTTLNYKKIK